MEGHSWVPWGSYFPSLGGPWCYPNTLGQRVLPVREVLQIKCFVTFKHYSHSGEFNIDIIIKFTFATLLLIFYMSSVFFVLLFLLHCLLLYSTFLEY